MDVVNFIVNAENLRTLFLFIAMIVGVMWLDRRSESRLRQELDKLAVSLRQEMSDLASSLRQEMDALAVSLRNEMDGLAASLRKDMENRFVVFHQKLKENDFAHLGKTIEALTFMLQKNGFLKPEDKAFIDSHLDDK